MAVASLYVKEFGEITNDKLAEILDGVIDNIQTSAVSEALKNTQGSGTPEAGVIEYKRFVNAELNDKGTARTNKKGSEVVAEPVFVNLNINKEIVEELQIKDVKLYGIEGMAEKRANNFVKRIRAFNDRLFFAKTVEGIEATDMSGLTTTQDKIDKLIVDAKSTESDFVDGIDAEDLALVLSPEYRKDLKNAMDKLPEGTDAKNGLIGRYDGVDVFETHRLPKGIKAVVMLKGAVAMPYFVSEYSAEKINLDDAIALQSFLYIGAEQLVPEAIYVDGTVASA